jgi:hypothetical protein
MNASRPNALALVARIRELARAELAAGVKSGLDALPQTLREQEAAASGVAEQRIIAEASGRARTSRDTILTGFEQRFLESFDKRLDRGRPGVPSQPLSLDQLTLVEDGLIEDQIAIGKLRSKTLNELDADELLGVETRIGDLLGRGGPVEREENPVDPDAALSALKHAIDAAADEGAVRTTILNVLQPHLALALRKLYFEVNEQLIAAGIVPRLRHEIQRARDNPAAHGGAAGGGPGLAAGAGGRRRPDLTVSQVLSLKELLPGASGMPLDLGAIVSSMLGGPAASLQSGARMMANADGSLYASAVATPVSADVLASLAQLQAAALAGPAGVPIAGGALSGAMPVPAAAGAPLSGVALAEALQRMTGAGAHPLDQLTGELVSVVFDFVLADRSVPAPVKAEIARLRVVALKAALLDRSFFARREHPMRRLLGRVTELASDPEVDTAVGAPFLVALHEVVDDLNARFETDLAVFDAAITRIEAAAIAATRAADPELEAVTARLAEREREGEARAAAAAEVERRVADDMPEFVHVFLRSVWAPAIARAHLSGGATDAREAALQAMDDLVWSIAPKTRADVPRLAAMLPKLVSAMQKGMQAADMPQAERQAFLDALMRTHTSLLEAARAPGNVPPPPPRPVPVATPALDASMPMGELAAAAATLGFLRLDRGMTVEFGDVEPPVRMKVGWVSPKRTMYAFRAAGHPPRSLEAPALAEALKSGKVRLVEGEASAVDRALAAAVGD